MSSFLQRFIWFTIAASVLSYACYLVIGSMLYAVEAETETPSIVQDRVKVNEHSLSGIVILPSTCLQLKASIEASATLENVYVINLETWETASVQCDNEPVPRIFQAKVFAPSFGVRFIAQLDGIPFPISVHTVQE